MSSEEDSRPLCFVLMPFGTKRDPAGGVVQFDEVYRQIIQPAVQEAGLRPLRADEERVGGIIHKPMFERLVLCDYAVADLSLANANVYYELGVRHAVRPWSTALTFVTGFRLPFDLGPLRGMSYGVDESGYPNRVDADRAALREALCAARERSPDSPVFQLLDGFPVPDISHVKTDSFRDRVAAATRLNEQLACAAKAGPEAVRDLWRGLGDLREVETGVIVDVLLTLRALEAHEQMVELVDAMPEVLAQATLVREQCAFALNRLGRGEEAERILLRLLEDKGPSSETYGLLGRVYKDRWQAAQAEGNPLRARGLLDKSIHAYVKGFETDWRDHYPGINAIQLMILREPPDPRAQELLPIVRYSVRRRLASGRGDYWDHATLLELAVLADDADGALESVASALATLRAPWEAKSTLQTLRRLRAARQRQGQDMPWLGEVEQALEEAALTETAPGKAVP